MPANVHTPAESASHLHYDPNNGKWDGQLPVAGILSQVPENWPSIIERDSFVDLAAVTLNLSACQTATFRRIAFRAGSASQGCWESQDNMARYLGYKRRAVQRALDHLQDLSLIHRVSRASTKHTSGAEQKCTTREVIGQRKCPRQLFGRGVTEAGWQQAGRVSE